MYLRYEQNAASEVRFFVPDGDPPRTLYNAPGIQQLQLVAPAVAAAPAGFTLPSGCRVLSAASSAAGVSRWRIDCGTQRNAGARGTLEPALRDAGWQLCGTGLASASWREGDLVTVIAEPVDPAASFSVSQRTSASCP